MAPTSISTFARFAPEARGRIEESLARYVRLPAACPPHLADAIRYSLLAPAKRLRPLMVLMAAEACGGTIERALPAACAVEMVHTYSLIHDDLPAMDDDDLRRGRPTCHKAFDEATAILAGDSLLAMAFEVLARDVSPAETAAACCRALATAAGPTALVGGQAADLEGSTGSAQGPTGNPQGLTGGADVTTLEAIHRRKTGALLNCALELGGLTAQASGEQLAALDAYGRPLGLAFQIIDDLLDVGGDAAALGKNVGKDAQRGKLTFPGLLGVDESRRRAQVLVAEAGRALEPLGPMAEGLEALAQFVLERDR
jgi:geranylgeranyl diphosphate synthase, type II